MAGHKSLIKKYSFVLVEGSSHGGFFFARVLPSLFVCLASHSCALSIPQIFLSSTENFSKRSGSVDLETSWPSKSKQQRYF
ncbi:hypothetical protein CARUB_v10007871mg [Capsella rubella]|uniref:Uncharacterized protein n=1 Tax=Capsella rubella TaxID=81985 RepID=R0FAY0_9BRAS|nr:hypothetical protein CARUB_v10007871mg [Capsella rubella]